MFSGEGDCGIEATLLWFKVVFQGRTEKKIRVHRVS